MLVHPKLVVLLFWFDLTGNRARIVVARPWVLARQVLEVFVEVALVADAALSAAVV